MFEINDKIFYPRYGVGTVVSTEIIQVEEEKALFFILEFEFSKERIYLPKNKAAELGLRSLCTPLEIENFWIEFKKPLTINWEDSWKDRKKDLEDLFAKGDIFSLGLLLRLLFRRHQFRPLGARERQLYDLSYEFLLTEIAFVTQSSYTSIEHKMAKSLQPLIDQTAPLS